MSCEGPFPYLVTSCVDPRTHQRHQINLQTPTGNIQPFLSFRIEQGSLPFIHLAKRHSVSYGVGISCVLAKIVFVKAVAVPDGLEQLCGRWDVNFFPGVQEQAVFTGPEFLWNTSTILGTNSPLPRGRHNVQNGWFFV